MNDILNERATIGGNNPPADLVEELRARHKQLFDQIAEVTDAAAQVPEKIDNDITHARVLELSKKMHVIIKQLDAVRGVELEPFKEKVSQVNGVFKSRIDPLKTLREKIDKLHEDYSLAKAAAEKRRLEEEAEKRRAEAERLQREAEEAERKRLEAKRQREEEERKAREAEEAKLRAIKEREEAERRADEERQRTIELAAKRKRAEEEEAERRRVAREQQAKDEAEAAVRKEQERLDREAHEKRMAEMRAMEEEAKEARRKADAEAAEAKQKADYEKRRQRDAEDAAAASRREEKTAFRDERDALNSATRQEGQAFRLQQKAEGPEADLARARSEHGAVGTLTRRWQCTLTDRNLVNREELWPFINEDAISAAAYKWMMAQAQENRRMPGTVMEEVTVGAVR